MTRPEGLSEAGWKRLVEAMRSLEREHASGNGWGAEHEARYLVALVREAAEAAPAIQEPQYPDVPDEVVLPWGPGAYATRGAGYPKSQTTAWTWFDMDAQVAFSNTGPMQSDEPDRGQLVCYASQGFEGYAVSVEMNVREALILANKLIAFAGAALKDGEDR